MEVACFSDSDSALIFLKQQPSAAIVCSCFNLPGRGGSAFLRASEIIAPMAARVMLTRERSAEAVKQALNEGHAFMFLDKPSQPADLVAAMETALAHHRQLFKDRALLERTLAGSVKLLIDMMALFHPEAFRRTGVVRKQALKLAKALGMKRPGNLKWRSCCRPWVKRCCPNRSLPAIAPPAA